MGGIFFDNELERDLKETKEPVRTPAERARDDADMWTFLNEAFADKRVKIIREGQAERERELVATFEEDFADDVAKAYEETTPDPKTRKRFGDAISRFGAFARECECSPMPAHGATIGTWLISSAMKGSRPMQLRRDAEALKFAHCLANEAIIDPVHLDAGLAVAIRIATVGDGGGGNSKPTATTARADQFVPTQLAAAGQ